MDTTADPVIINNVYYDVDILTNKDSIDTPIWKIYSNSNFGVLRYELENGDWWELQL